MFWKKKFDFLWIIVDITMYEKIFNNIVIWTYDFYRLPADKKKSGGVEEFCNPSNPSSQMPLLIGIYVVFLLHKFV